MRMGKKNFSNCFQSTFSAEKKSVHSLDGVFNCWNTKVLTKWTTTTEFCFLLRRHWKKYMSFFSKKNKNKCDHKWFTFCKRNLKDDWDIIINKWNRINKGKKISIGDVFQYYQGECQRCQCQCNFMLMEGEMLERIFEIQSMRIQNILLR